jgi:DNA (cytosine-5)-methyltransferase 1
VQDAAQGHLMPIYGGSDPNTSDTVTSKWAKGSGGPDGNECGLFVAQPIPLNTMNCFRSPNADASTGCGIGEQGEAMFTITKTNSHAVAQPVYELHSQDSRVRELGDVCTTVSATYGAGGGNVPITLMQAMAVRRLTPVECERLQGFGDNYTDIQPKGKATPDGPRYKALGNSMAVPVMAWIGKRIQEVDAICKTQQNT